ncbi:hypothetical protein OH77DRAFT_1500325 [Trametes cingulata]|nr:hypothetical protein OH77DRAFT_1500325 [Trametes cingulata]
MNICNDCMESLNRHSMPRFALANNLYRGTLPSEFHDLTWVEEMVCAIYHTHAKVTRLYGSNDPTQPRVFHGNICTHDLNVVSTASVLPRTPADINGMLSVVFIGPEKFDLNKVGTIFRVRKYKIMRFLYWLKGNNILYSNIPIEDSIIQQYPDDGALPGLIDSVIHDKFGDQKN